MDEVQATDRFGFFDRILCVFTKPSYLFTRLKQETNVWSTFLTLIVVALVAGAISHGLTTTVLSSFLGAGEFGFGAGLLMSTVSSFVAVLFLFLYAGVVHGICKLFSGTGTYTNTYTVYGYSLVPVYIFNILPFIGAIIGAIYSLVLGTKGLSIVHEIPGVKAFLALFMPAVLVIGLLIIIIIYLLSSFAGVF